MVIFQYNLYIFWIHLWTVLYPKPCYNEPRCKEVVVYMFKYIFSVRWKILLGFNCRNRLLLTGTPIQNSMAEVSAVLLFFSNLDLQSDLHVCLISILLVIWISPFFFHVKIGNFTVHHIAPDKRGYPHNIFSYFSTKIYIVGTPKSASLRCF